MGETYSAVAQGSSHLARKKSEGYTWASTHLPLALADDIKRVAHKEQRTVSFMVRLLCAEALRVRGELTARDDDEDDE